MSAIWRRHGLVYGLRRIVALEEALTNAQGYIVHLEAALRQEWQQMHTRQAQLESNLAQINERISPLTTALVQAPPPPAAPITVAPDSDLASIVAAAPAGAQLHLAAGVYQLAQSLEINKPLSLHGAGMEVTRIVGTSEGAVLRYEGTGRVELMDLHVTCEGTNPAHGVDVTDAEVAIERCRFSSFVADETGSKPGGCGLILRGQACGTVIDCVCIHNVTGIGIIEQAQPTLEGNMCRENERGISFAGTAGGRATRNTCTTNKRTGITVWENAQPQIEENTCCENEWGIAFTGTAGGRATRNTCTANKSAGIVATENAQPTLEGNMCRENEWGITFTGTAGGRATRNTCTANKGAGIVVWENAQPQIEENTCCENEWGITFTGTAGGRATRNTCTANKGAGIAVWENAQPQIEENTCRENEWGISFAGTAGGRATRNTCTTNKRTGIAVWENAQPQIEENTCRENEWGISFAGTAGGRATRNTCTANKGAGIVVWENAQPQIEENTCRNNESGITISESARPRLFGNTCIFNIGNGIVYEDTASGEVVSNICKDNGFFGIVIHGKARPNLRENVFFRNGAVWRILSREQDRIWLYRAYVQFGLAICRVFLLLAVFTWVVGLIGWIAGW